MSPYRLYTGSTIECPEGVLLPDVVTEQLAQEAAAALNELDGNTPVRIMELGIGSAAFSRCVLDLAEVQVDVVGVDLNSAALETAERNLEGHRNLKALTLVNADWHGEDTIKDGLFNTIYFNPPYLKPGSKLREEFEGSPMEAVYTTDPTDEYLSVLPMIVNCLVIGGLAIVRYPGDGSVTFAGESTKDDHDPWVDISELDATVEKLLRRKEWANNNLPPDTRSFMWRSLTQDRRINAEIFTRIGDSISNAPKLIRDMDEYWSAYA